MPLGGRKSSIFSIPLVLVCILAGTLLIFWVTLGTAGYFGIGLYRDYLQLKEENGHLLQKKKDLDEMRLVIKHVEKNEEIIRSVLALEKSQAVAGDLGQGGMPATNLSSIFAENKLSSASISLPAKAKALSILAEAKSLQKSLQELVGTMRERRQLLDHTPSIVPLKAKDYWFSSGFGWRSSPFTGMKEFHDGVDISAPKDTPIIAPGDGRLITKAYHRYRGKYLQIDHGWGCITTYAHLSRFSGVSAGQEVKRGEVIGYTGNTGRSTGTHLHYEIEIKGRVINPIHYILNAKVNRLLESQLPVEVDRK